MIQPKDIALAAQALNRIPNLSPAARRVGVELLQRMDRNTGLTWPSQERLGEALGLSVRSISSAIAQLRAMGFLTWKASRRATHVYHVAVKALVDAAERVKAALRSKPQEARRTAVAGARAKPSAAAPLKTGSKLQPIYSVVSSSKETKQSALLWQRLSRLSPAVFTAIISTASEDEINSAAHLEGLKEGSGIKRLLNQLQGSLAYA